MAFDIELRNGGGGFNVALSSGVGGTSGLILSAGIVTFSPSVSGGDLKVYLTTAGTLRAGTSASGGDLLVRLTAGQRTTL